MPGANPEPLDRPVRVAIDIYPLLGQATGIGQYVRGLIQGLSQRPPDGDYSLFSFSWAGRPVPGAVPATGNVHYRHVAVPGRVAELPAAQALLRRWWGTFDVAHVTNYHPMPVRARRELLTVYDLIFDVLPGTFPPGLPDRYRHRLRLCLDRAAKVVAISNATRDLLATGYGVDPANVAVIPPAIMPLSSGRQLRADIRGTLPDAAGKNDRPLILYLGTIEDRKNLVRLVWAFSLVRRAVPGDCRLVLAGRPGFGAERVTAAIAAADVSDRVDLVGYVSEEHKRRLLDTATLFVYPSLYEGFGMPVLEAMAAGVPVVASDIPSVAEAAGGAALLADPLSVDDLAAKLQTALSDPDRRRQLAEAGRHRATRFTPAALADAYHELYRALS